MKTVFIVSFFVCMMLIASIAWSEIVYVNGTTGDDDTGERGNPDKPFKTIQKGIDVAVSGEDTVLVADGMYTGTGNKNLDFKGKAITVTSENGAESTIIDCENNDRGFYLHRGETATINGFKIINGKAAEGGGIYCSGFHLTITNLTITNCIIENNRARDGGGIYGYNASLEIIKCEIIENEVDPRIGYEKSRGGGIYCSDSSMTISECSIEKNINEGWDGYTIYSGSNGGGIYCAYSSTRIDNCIINENFVGGGWNEGGGICFTNSSPTITNCEIIANEAYYGGGIFLNDCSDPEITNCNIRKNKTIKFISTWGDFVGIYCSNSSPMITNCLIADNGTSFSDYGGIYCSSPKIINTTITGNSGYGISANSPIVLNTILWDGLEIGDDSTITYSCIQGGWPGEGNIDDCPFLDCHLQPGSPAIDAGNPLAFCNDLDGTRNDMGCSGGSGLGVNFSDSYHFVITVDSISTVSTVFEVYNTRPTTFESVVTLSDTVNFSVDVVNPFIVPALSTGEIEVTFQPSGLGQFNAELTFESDDFIGTNQAIVALSGEYRNPKVIHVPGEYETIQAGIDAACNGDMVLVADGIYNGDGNKDLDFGGKAIEVKSEHGAEATIIDCEDDGRGFFFHSGESESSVVSGFTIMNGYESNGGGIYCFDSSPTLRDCIITGNTADNGGGVYCSQSSIALIDCTITGNIADGDGGGIYCFGTLTMTNCSITDNKSDDDGGGIYCSESTLINCLIADNKAPDYGGGIYCSESLTLTNCTFTKNDGGGIYCDDSSPILKNCILWRNFPDEIYPPTAVVTYSDVRGGWEGEGNIDVDPLFVDPDNGSYYLGGCSPCVDAGTPNGAPPDDIEGNPRDEFPDMGAFEFHRDIFEPAKVEDLEVTKSALSSITLTWTAPGDDGVVCTASIYDIRYAEVPIDEGNWDTATRRCEGEPPPQEAGTPESFTATGLSQGTIYYFAMKTEDEVPKPSALSNVLRTRTLPGLTIHVATWGDDETGDGSPEKPYRTIQKGIDVALVNGDTVMVHDGTYTGVGNKDLNFKGKAITVTSENGAEKTTIDCENDGRGFYFRSGETSESVVSGFTITNGDDSEADVSGGGGILCKYNSSPTIQNNILKGNSTKFRGGGIYCDGNSSPTIQNNTIKENMAYDTGGGIHCDDSSPTIQNNTITGNIGFTGGGIFCDDSSSTIQNNTIKENTANHSGGGIYDSSSSTIQNNTITGNTANMYGGGIRISSDSSTISNNTITGNTADYGGGICCGNSSITNNTITGNTANSGGGIYCYKSSPTITNTILWNDSPGEIYLYGDSSITVSYSDVQGGEDGIGGSGVVNWGEGNIDADPLFADNGYLQGGSPCLGSANCEDAPPTDKDGRPRPLPSGGGCDMGCYEQYDDGRILIYGDVSWDSNVTAYDAALVLQYVTGLTDFSIAQQQAADVTDNGNITALDAALILQYTVGLITQFPLQQGAPILTAKDENQILTKIIAELETVSLTTDQKHVLEQLKQLIGQQPRPSHTVLLQNYPNPFNPETWLPYKLAQDASVTIRIYNVKGQLIRALHLGNKNAGVYMTKDKAAHWDGKDRLGQAVASGVYFYTLQVKHPDRDGAGAFTATRRMVILK